MSQTHSQIREGAISEVFVGGFLNIDKPAGWTSHDVVAKVRGLLGIKRVGHLGTLDPDATGVLPLCFGKGTKLASLLGDADKTYDAVLRLGQETDTEDASGEVIKICPVPDRLKSEVGEAEILDVLLSFMGRYLQQPPMYSAIKIKGVPLYKMARSGKVVERSKRELKILSLNLLASHGGDIAFRVRCSKGTYIRTLCVDIGRKLGVGAHLLSLRRVQAGPFSIDDALELETLSAYCQDGQWEKIVYPANSVLSALPALFVSGVARKRLLNGVQLSMSALDRNDPFKKGDSLRFLDAEGRLIAIAQALRDSESHAVERVSMESFFKIKTVLGDGGC
ncbi:MAG: tRNA pseudouridine(55) synthase TruB [Nitrospirae bacterium]|nr:tRNA pseudouridine(55) synthase TruB [Candidatus Manganitrophaceae bacterium]